MGDTPNGSLMANGTFSAVVADRDVSGRKNLTHLIADFLPWMNLVGETGSVQETIAVVRKLKPRFLILNLNLGDGLGFEVIEATAEQDLEVVMTTGYAPKLMPAFCEGIAEWLYKPIGPQDLINCFEVLRKNMWSKGNVEQLGGQKILLAEQNQCHIVPFSEMVGFGYKGGKTICHLADGTVVFL